MRSRAVCALAVFLGVFVFSPTAHATITRVTCCFENPEVALWDAASKSWYVSSYGGYALDQVRQDGDGFISKLSADGEILEPKWVSGLGSPYDMDVYKGTLFIADISDLVVVDVASAKVLRKIPLPGSGALNGVGVDQSNGDVYVSGWTNDTIYRVAAARSAHPDVEIFLKSPKLETPNDMLIEARRMVVTADGPGFFTTSYDPTQGRLLTVDLRTKRVTPLTARFGVPDGIVRFGRDYVTDDYLAGRIIRVHPDGQMETISQHPPSTAELGFDPKRRLLSVAHAAENAVIFEEL